tara:strand:- start:14527 stop:15036 length:510 start_codon:yes stop_codon:yes gene_type:complete
MMHMYRQIFQSETFTGWHMWGVLVLFFGTIIGVNGTMAYFATSSWSGLIVKNTYVASQQFDDDVAATRQMRSHGWASSLHVDSKAITYSLTNALGSDVPVDTVAVSFTRPVGEEQDQILPLERQDSGQYSTHHRMNAGQWVVQVDAERDGVLIYRDIQRIVIDAEGNSR